MSDSPKIPPREPPNVPLASIPSDQDDAVGEVEQKKPLSGVDRAIQDAVSPKKGAELGGKRLLRAKLDDQDADRILDVAGPALGIDVESPLDQDRSTVSDFFLTIDIADLSALKEENKILAARRQKFQQNLKLAIQPNPQQKFELKRLEKFAGSAAVKEARCELALDNLRHFVFDQEGGVNRFDSDELTSILHAFSDLDSPDSMCDLMLRSKNSAFKMSPVNRELHASAALRQSIPDPQTAISLSVDLMRQDPGNVEARFVCGQAYEAQVHAIGNFLEQLDEAEGDITKVDPKVRSACEQAVGYGVGADAKDDLTMTLEHAVDRALKFYNQAFGMDFDPSHGIAYTNFLLQIGGREAAQNIAQLTALSCQRDGGTESRSCQVAIALFASNCIIGADSGDIQESMLHVLSLASTEAEIRDGIEHLQITSAAMQQQRGTHHVVLDSVVSALEGRLRALESGGSIDADVNDCKTQLHDQQRDRFPVHSKWTDASYSYRGLTSNRVSGNFRFGGQLFDHGVNRTDRRNFEQIISMNLTDLVDSSALSNEETEALKNAPRSFGEIEGVDEFNKWADVFIRQTFRNDELELEDLHSSGHKVFDKATQNIVSVGGYETAQERKDAADSQMNISVVMSLGLGDCRHHAQVKQLLFDTWQRQRTNNMMQTAAHALHEGSGDIYEQSVSAIEDVMSVELRTFDVTIRAPVKMNRMYDPVTKDGEHVATDGDVQVVEEHTTTLYLHRDADGEMTEAHRADAFYQNQYDWGGGALDIAEITDPDGVHAGTLPAFNEGTGTMEEVPVTFTPTAYAGKRDVYTPSDESTRFLGHRLNPFDVTDTVGATSRERVRHLHQALQDIA